MIYLTTVRNLTKGAGARGGFLIDAKDSFQAYEVALFFSHRLLGLPVETALEISPVAASQEAVPCQVVRTLAHSMPQTKSVKTTGVLNAVAMAAASDPFTLGCKITALLPHARIELPMALPLIDAADVRFIDSTGAVRSLGPIEDIDFDSPVEGLAVAAPTALQPALATS